MLGEWIRASARARVCRWEERRAETWAKCEGRVAQRGEEDRRASVAGVGCGVVMWEESIRISSMSSEGRTAVIGCAARAWGLSREVVVVVVVVGVLG